MRTLSGNDLMRRTTLRSSHWDGGAGAPSDPNAVLELREESRRGGSGEAEAARRAEKPALTKTPPENSLCPDFRSGRTGSARARLERCPPISSLGLAARSHPQSPHLLPTWCCVCGRTRVHRGTSAKVRSRSARRRRYSNLISRMPVSGHPSASLRTAIDA